MASYTPAQWFAVFLGYACIVGSVFRCLPQVHRIVTRKSVEGISFTAILSEFLIEWDRIDYVIKQTADDRPV